MKATQRYLIAKYAPDVRRMEPRNIGVILWVNGRVSSKFLDARGADFVTDQPTYQRWITYWQRLLGDSSISPPGGDPVTKSSSEFLDAFLTTQRDNYLLFDGGEVVDRVPAKEIDRATNYLFDQLVSRSREWPSDTRESSNRLRTETDLVLQQSGIAHRPDFKKTFPVECTFGAATKRFKFDYAIGNGKPSSLFQRVNLSAQMSVTGASFMFEQVQFVDKKHRAAIVYADNRAMEKADVISSMGVLEVFATVVNLAEHTNAIAALSQVAAV